MGNEELSDRLSENQPDQSQISPNSERPDLVIAPKVWGYHQESSSFNEKSTGISVEKKSADWPSLETGLSTPGKSTDQVTNGVLFSLKELQQLIAQKNHQGVKDPNLGNLYASIGKIYQNLGQQGEYRDYLQAQTLAAKCFEKAIFLQEEMGQEIDLADSLNRLGVIYYYKKQYQQAENLFCQSLGIRQRLLGENHLDVATSLSNLGMVNHCQKRYGDAEPLLWQALRMFKQIWGENHLDVASSLNNLANLYYSQNHYQKTEALLVYALEIFQRLLGKHHPNVARSLNNLGMVYYHLRRFEEAEPLYRQAWEIYQLVLGEKHPNTLIVRENMTMLWQKMHRL